MIDLATEHLIAIRDVPRHLPPRPTGRRVHISAVYRWILHGVRGVRLESITIGGTTYTSMEALQRFAESLRQDKLGPCPTTTVTSLTRQRQIEQATHQLRAILGNSEKPIPHR